MTHKLPLTPHVPFFPPPGAASVEAALLARIAALEAEVEYRGDRIRELNCAVIKMSGLDRNPPADDGDL